MKLDKNQFGREADEIERMRSVLVGIMLREKRDCQQPECDMIMVYDPKRAEHVEIATQVVAALLCK